MNIKDDDSTEAVAHGCNVQAGRNNDLLAMASQIANAESRIQVDSDLFSRDNAEVTLHLPTVQFRFRFNFRLLQLGVGYGLLGWHPSTVKTTRISR
jgi:hypothetical protein